ncbi:NADH-quinone oxidoreductase subunit C [Cytobacillus sp. IB215665]|uniref:NADH-quinone oxidoreductase subunit C n=1 Tax=Cytobacillus sp. IB215665 TaxID=3097357 RepID=UPI002A13DB49|nr:NADH-quinone oxidoreductase subunit C [Cytobacillus sp. IB215665]MDX8363706.1 NADH-quinone oxidoreductase subunit C [Cytobacillus sp. IB215665]
MSKDLDQQKKEAAKKAKELALKKLAEKKANDASLEENESDSNIDVAKAKAGAAAKAKAAALAKQKEIAKQKNEGEKSAQKEAVTSSSNDVTDLEKQKAAAAAKAKAAALAKQKAKEKNERASEGDEAKAKAAAAAKAKAAALAKQKAKEKNEKAPEGDEAKAKAAAAAKAKAAAAAKAKAAALAKQQRDSGNEKVENDDAAAAKAKAIAAAKAKAKAAAAAKAKASGATESDQTVEKKPSQNQPYLDKYVKVIEEHLGKEVLSDSYINELSKDVPTLVATPDSYFKIAEFLKYNEQLSFDYLSNIHGTDFVSHMEVYVHLYSYINRQTVALKVKIDREEPIIDSLQPLWEGANWPEREAYDLLGINFKGHPNLARILLAEDWVGYPLRKDYEPYDVEV